MVLSFANASKVVQNLQYALSTV